MRYSTVFVAAAFSAGAMARAVPEGNDIIRLPTEYPTEKNTEYPTEKYPGKTEYPTEKYPGKNEYPTEKYPGKNEYPTEKYPGKNEYPTKEDKYPPKKEEQEYAPVKKQCYEDKKKSEGDKYKPYFPEPKDYDEKKSCYGNLEWATNVKAEKPCPIKWGPKEGSWKKEDEAVIYIYKCDDYSKPYEKVCDSCGEGEHNDWKPKKDCKPSNAEGGATYRFKFCKKDNEDEYTWGEEFPIWNDEYYKEKPTEKPVENQCPPPAPVPVYDESPVAKAPETPATYPAAAPAEAAAPAYPSEAAAGTAPSSLVANETAPAPEVAFNGSGALRASISVIVGVAALVTFAL